MNTYLIPREMHDENRFLIFSKMSAIFMLIGVGIGTVISIPFFILASALDVAACKYVGYTIVAIITLIFYAMGTFKIPETNAFELTRKAGGEEIDKFFLRWLKFRKKKNVIYTYLGTKEEQENE